MIDVEGAERMLLKTTILVIKTRLQVRNYFVTIEKDLPGGHQIRLSTGSVINLSTKGKIVLQGKPDNELKEMLGFLRD
ncbi:hypothetical protein [Sphingobacterium yanglingense]|uniref:Uncharacterized protein n=1 Tax=Sphingobacterium yanglingense TaxID=1437280 RepID=A0A4R6WN55_9SPHI|nr:hypothetical protein [Sphingobacterium yanglingense]TDQ79531.1 hypothetical protein CLV99_0973 [Sphingobacterium yanglingense]